MIIRMAPSSSATITMAKSGTIPMTKDGLNSIIPEKYRNTLQLTFCASGICCSFWLYGFLQENLFSKSELGATFLLVTQTLLNTLVACLWLHIQSSASSSSPPKAKETLDHPLLFLVSSTYVFTMTCANECLRFVSYPTAVLAKSCKLIPTMVMGRIIEKRNYSMQQWMSALCISLGIAMFNLSRVKQQTTTETDGDDALKVDQYWKGMGLLFISLCMDGCLGSLQGILKKGNTAAKRRRPTAVETMLFVNLYSLAFLVPMAVTSGQLSHGIQILKHDRSLLWPIVIMNGVVSIGQIFIFLTITWYSSLVCTTITTTRKFFTILFSVLHFGHKFSAGQWTSVGMVFSGLYLSIAANGRQLQTVHPSKTEKQD